VTLLQSSPIGSLTISTSKFFVCFFTVVMWRQMAWIHIYTHTGTYLETLTSCRICVEIYIYVYIYMYIYIYVYIYIC
jgi:hypothetical protein